MSSPLACVDTVSLGPPVQQKAPGETTGATVGEDSHYVSPFSLQNGGVELQMGRPHGYAGGKSGGDNGARCGD